MYPENRDDTVSTELDSYSTIVHKFVPKFTKLIEDFSGDTNYTVHRINHRMLGAFGVLDELGGLNRVEKSGSKLEFFDKGIIRHTDISPISLVVWKSLAQNKLPLQQLYNWQYDAFPIPCEPILDGHNGIKQYLRTAEHSTVYTRFCGLSLYQIHTELSILLTKDDAKLLHAPIVKLLQILEEQRNNLQTNLAVYGIEYQDFSNYRNFTVEFIETQFYEAHRHEINTLPYDSKNITHDLQDYFLRPDHWQVVLRLIDADHFVPAIPEPTSESVPSIDTLLQSHKLDEKILGCLLLNNMSLPELENYRNIVESLAEEGELTIFLTVLPTLIELQLPVFERLQPQIEHLNKVTIQHIIFKLTENQTHFSNHPEAKIIVTALLKILYTFSDTAEDMVMSNIIAHVVNELPKAIRLELQTVIAEAFTAPPFITYHLLKEISTYTVADPELAARIFDKLITTQDQYIFTHYNFYTIITAAEGQVSLFKPLFIKALKSNLRGIKQLVLQFCLEQMEQDEFSWYDALSPYFPQSYSNKFGIITGTDTQVDKIAQLAAKRGQIASQSI